MGDANSICTLGDYSKPSHKGYRNTIELPVGNNVVPLRSDTIRLVQNGCSFHRLRSEDPNQYLKDFLKLVDSLDLDGSITTWEDLTTRFLAQFIPPGRTAKLRNDILMFQQHQGESLLEAWTQDLGLYDNESWNDPRDFAKPVKAISLPQDVLSTSDRRLIELKNQFQRLIKAHLALMQQTQVNKITSSCEICSGPHDTQYCMKNPEQAFVDYASSRTDGTRSRQFAMNQTVSEKLDDTPIRDTAGNPAAQMNFTSTNDPTSEELRGKGIKIPSNLLSPKYMSKSSLVKQNRNASSPKCVHFINSIVILNKEDEAKEKGNSSNSIHSFDHWIGSPVVNAVTRFAQRDSGDVMFIEIVPKDDASRMEEPKAGE
ncbi:MAK10-like protein [Tanacetum coccineum]